MRPGSHRFPSRIILLLLVLYGCIEPEFRPLMPKGEVMGYRPVYSTDVNTHITFESPRPLKAPGKIYSYPPYLLVNELNQGIHFFNNNDPKNPEPIGFLKVGGNTDFVMKGNIMYVNNYSDLVAINISNKSNITELSRIAQPTWIADFPPMNEYRYFECVDPDKGKLIGWELATITNPKCYR